MCHDRMVLPVGQQNGHWSFDFQLSVKFSCHFLTNQCSKTELFFFIRKIFNLKNLVSKPKSKINILALILFPILNYCDSNFCFSIIKYIFKSLSGFNDDAAAKNVASQQEGQRLESWLGPCCREFACFLQTWVFSKYSYFLPQLKNHAGLVIGDSKMTL